MLIIIIIVWWHQFSIFHCFAPTNDANFYFSSTVSIRVIVIIVVVVVFVFIIIVYIIVVQVCQFYIIFCSTVENDSDPSVKI